MNRHHQDHLSEAIKAGPKKVKHPNRDTGGYDEIEVVPKDEDLEAVKIMHDEIEFDFT